MRNTMHSNFWCAKRCTGHNDVTGEVRFVSLSSTALCGCFGILKNGGEIERGLGIGENLANTKTS